MNGDAIAEEAYKKGRKDLLEELHTRFKEDIGIRSIDGYRTTLRNFVQVELEKLESNK